MKVLKTDISALDVTFLAGKFYQPTVYNVFYKNLPAVPIVSGKNTCIRSPRLAALLLGSTAAGVCVRIERLLSENTKGNPRASSVCSCVSHK
jgi:hypothetical protein